MAENHNDPNFNCPYQEEFGETKATMNFIKESVKRIEAYQEKQNGRLGNLEAWRNRLLGAWGLVMILMIPMAIEIVRLWVRR
jgi:hypothetical protein